MALVDSPPLPFSGGDSEEILGARPAQHRAHACSWGHRSAEPPRELPRLPHTLPEPTAPAWATLSQSQRDASLRSAADIIRVPAAPVLDFRVGGAQRPVPGWRGLSFEVPRGTCRMGWAVGPSGSGPFRLQPSARWF